MNAIDFKCIDIKGELAVRSCLNYARLEGKWYRPEEIFTADKHGWPGDWEGRTILALIMLAQSTHRTPAYLDEIMDRVPQKLNEKGYFGQILPKGINDEQQMSGNSWALRAFCEYYKWKKDEKIKKSIVAIVDNLLLPSRGNYSKYPLDPEDRLNSTHWKLSKLQSKTKAHSETSDAGCAFIMLDGATIAYELLKSAGLRELIDEMITRYLEVDFVNLHIQTHATLSGLRGILRLYELENNPEHLNIAKKIFDFYKTEAWTEAYGNYNWFGHPRWTEPCAIIDSFIVATNLWKHTGDPVYIEDAHHIYHNALCHGQRANGSFGTDRCLGAADAEKNVFIDPVNYETYWCCSMRAGEGFSRAIEYNFFINGNELYVPFYNDCTAVIDFKCGKMKIREKTGYPYDGKVSVEVLESSLKGPCEIKFFAPTWSDSGNIKVRLNKKTVASKFDKGFICMNITLAAGDMIELDLGLKTFAQNVTGKNSVKGYHTFRYGPLLLGYTPKVEIEKEDIDWYSGEKIKVYKTPAEIKLGSDTLLKKTGRAVFEAENSAIILTPLCDVAALTREDSIKQMIFRD